MIKDFLSLQEIILSFEASLGLKYDEADPRLSIQNSIKYLESTYDVTINDTIYNLQSQSTFIGDKLAILVEQIKESTKQLALFVATARFYKEVPLKLSSVNYLGVERESLRTAFKYLQDSKLYEQRSDVISSLISASNVITMSLIKRVLYVLFVLERLGFEESVNVIASLLYMGGWS